MPSITAVDKSRLLSILPNFKDKKVIFKAISLIVTLGSLFFLLAAYQVLPSVPNSVSQLGGWGKAIGYTLLVISLLSYLSVQKKIKTSEQFVPPPPLIQTSHYQEEFANMCSEFETLKQGPKRISDGQEFDVFHFTDLKSQAMELTRKLQGEHSDIKTALSGYILEFKALHEAGKYRVTPIDPDLNDAAYNIHRRNQMAEELNQAIDQTRDELALKLAQEYPDSDSPPEELASSSLCLPLSELAESWRAQRLSSN